MRSDELRACVVVEGPRFSTRAESAWFQRMGWDIVSMTAYPEGWPARELGLWYANLSLITDYDVGVLGDDALAPVTAAAVVEAFAANIDRLRSLLAHVLTRVGPPPPDDPCARALEDAGH